MSRRRISVFPALSSLLLLASAVLAPAAQAAGDYGPDTCLDGWVWREASASDHVCVTGATRSQTANDNALAAPRRAPNGGPYGPDTCLQGYVWREASTGDHVCVTGATRSHTWADNAQASARRDSVNVWHSTYTVPPRCTGDTCTSTSTDDIPRFRLNADHLNPGWVTVQLRRASSGVVMRSWTTYVGLAGYTPGGRLSLDTAVFDCGGAVDSYFLVRDPSSGRWSAPHYVSTICAVL